MVLTAALINVVKQIVKAASNTMGMFHKFVKLPIDTRDESRNRDINLLCIQNDD